MKGPTKGLIEVSSCDAGLLQAIGSCSGALVSGEMGNTYISAIVGI
jgi:hypothetical protein